MFIKILLHKYNFSFTHLCIAYFLQYYTVHIFSSELTLMLLYFNMSLNETNVSSIKNESVYLGNSSNFRTHCLYIVFGSTAFFANFTICFVLLRNVKFLKTSAFLAGYAFSETFLGVAHVVVGSLRLHNVMTGTRIQIHPVHCMYRWTALNVTTSQVQSTMLILIGLERLLAAVFFNWYYKKWTSRKAWILTCLAYAYCLGSTAIIWIIVSNYCEDYKISSDCSSLSVLGNVYSIYERSLVVISGIWVSGVTLFALIVMVRKRSRSHLNDTKLKRFEQKQLRVTISMTGMACVDFVLVVIPGSLTHWRYFFQP